MTGDVLKRECRYEALMHQAKRMLHAGLITEQEFQEIEARFRTKYKPISGGYISDCDAGRIDIVLVKSISRFARNTVDLLNTVRHLKDIGVEVWFEDEGIHSMDGDGELMLTILASFAQEESRSISENCKCGIRKQYERGASRGCTKAARCSKSITPPIT